MEALPLPSLRIRDERLYRATHDTFEAYCRERWSMSRFRAQQLISAAGVVENLFTTVNIKPTNEAQVRPLTTLSPENQRVVWDAGSRGVRRKAANGTEGRGVETGRSRTNRGTAA